MDLRFKLESFASSDVGLVRKNNEDSFKELHQEHFFVLADGLGGHNAGEVASSRAVEYMCSAIQDLKIKDKTHLPLEDLTIQIGSLIENTNSWVHHLGSNDPELKGMGTTLCSLLFYKNFAIYSHVGDSRIYRLRKNILTQLTFDHVKERQKLGPPGKGPIGGGKKSNGQVYSTKKILAQAIGTTITINPEIRSAKAQPGDIYLMCSDGLTDLVSNEELQSQLSETSDLESATSSLINVAKSRGGHDNITLVLVRLL